MFKNIKIGDEVIIERFKNYGDKKSEFQKFEVIKKGRLYFYVIRNGCELKFSLKTGEESTNYCRMNKAYASIEACEEEKERSKKCHELYLHMTYKYNLEQLTLKELIEIGKITGIFI